MRIHGWFLGAVCLVAAVSCGDDLGLSERSDGDGWEHHRRRANLTVVDGNGNQTEIDSGQLADELKTSCEEILSSADCDSFKEQGSPDEPPVLPASSCADTGCWMQFRLCVAHRAMELANAVSAVQAGAYTVPPQDAAPRTTAAELAMAVTRETLLLGTDAIRALAGRSSAGACVAGTGTNDAGGDIDLDDSSNGEVIGTLLAEAYWC